MSTESDKCNGGTRDVKMLNEKDDRPPGIDEGL